MDIWYIKKGDDNTWFLFFCWKWLEEYHNLQNNFRAQLKYGYR